MSSPGWLNIWVRLGDMLNSAANINVGTVPQEQNAEGGLLHHDHDHHAPLIEHDDHHHDDDGHHHH